MRVSTTVDSRRPEWTKRRPASPAASSPSTSARASPPTRPGVSSRTSASSRTSSPARRRERPDPLPLHAASNLAGALAAPGERERAALGVAADRPSLTGVDDAAAELDHLLGRRGDVGDLEVGQRERVTGPAAALVDADRGAASVRSPTPLPDRRSSAAARPRAARPRSGAPAPGRRLGTRSARGARRPPDDHIRTAAEAL